MGGLPIPVGLRSQGRHQSPSLISLDRAAVVGFEAQFSVLKTVAGTVSTCQGFGAICTKCSRTPTKCGMTLGTASIKSCSDLFRMWDVRQVPTKGLIDIPAKIGKP